MRSLIFVFVLFSFLDIQIAAAETQQIAVQYTDKGFYFVDVYHIESDGWQDRRLQKKFNTQKESDQFAEQFKKNNDGELLTAPSVLRNPTPLWQVHHQWNFEWENKYTEWVRENLNKNFFVKYQISTDCADVAFSIRWIFARIHGLPAAVTLAGSQRLFTQNDARPSWSSLPTSETWHEDTRFRTALDYVMRNTYTHSLLIDSYPVEISPFGIQPGGYHLTIRTESGHTRMIYSTDVNSTANHLIRFVASDVPSQIRVLHEEPFSLKKFLPRTNGGFMRFRWPQLKADGTYQLTPEEEMPFYSLQQYGEEFQKSYYNSVLKNMGITNKPDEFIRLRLEVIWDKLQYRVGVAQKGFVLCQTEDCAPGTVNYEDWGTPSRDSQVQDLVIEVLQTYWENSDDRKVIAEFNKWRDLTLNIGDEYQTEVRYEDLLMIWYQQDYSFDPRDSLFKRWGIDLINRPELDVQTSGI